MLVYKVQPCTLGGLRLNPGRTRSHLICRSEFPRRYTGNVEEYRHPELDNVNYRRDDMSIIHAFEARKAFLQEISKGEASVNLAEAALLIAAEDDALVSHSAVKFPVASYLQRLQRMADELASSRLPPLTTQNAPPQDQLQLIWDYLFIEKGIKPPSFGRSNVPTSAVVDNPGVWEDARLGYVNHALVSRRGIPAVLSIVLGDILQRLLVLGAIDFVAKIDARDMGAPPRAHVLQGVSRESALTRIGGEVAALNTCSLQTVIECLRYLKRAYWPFPWDSARGGFRGGAKSFLDGQQSAEGEAISRAAEHRLQRGIWTSPGGGDLRRAIAACEKLVVLAGAECPEERRDLAVLYCNVGKLEAAAVELKAYRMAKHASRVERGVQAFILSESGITSASTPQELENEVLVDRLLALLSKIPKSEPPLEPLSLETALEQEAPTDMQLLPLTW